MLKPKDAMSFEAKHIYVLLLCILITLWRVEQSIKIAKPFILKYQHEHDGNNPSIKQLREKLKELPFHDFVFDFCYDALHELQIVAGQELLSTLSPNCAAAVLLQVAQQPSSFEQNGMDNMSPEDIAMHQQLEACTRSGNAWPVKMKRRTAFAELPLSDLRHYVSTNFTHGRCKLVKSDTNAEGRVKCAVCSSNDCQQNTMYECGTCKVPMCWSPLEPGQPSCQELWHSEMDLEEAHSKQNNISKRKQQESKESGKHEHSRWVQVLT